MKHIIQIFLIIPTILVSASSYAQNVLDAYEDDSSMGQAREIFYNSPMPETHTFHDPNDSDWVMARLDEGETVELGIIGGPSANGSPTIFIADAHYPNGNVVPIAAGDPEVMMAWTAPLAGEYRIEIRPDPTAWFPDEHYDLYLYIEENIPIPPDSHEDDDSDIGLAVELIPNTDYMSRNLHHSADIDWFFFNAVQEAEYFVDTFVPAANDFPTVELYDAQSNPLMVTDPSGINSTLKGYTGIVYARISGNSANEEYLIAVYEYFPDYYDEDDMYSSAESIDPTAEDPSQTHNFHDPGDQDWVEFQAYEDVSYIIEVSELGPECDIVLELYGPDGITLIEYENTPDDPTANETIVWTPEADGTYYVRTQNANSDTFGEKTQYRLSVKREMETTSLGYLEGYVTDKYTGSPIGDAKISADSETYTTSSSIRGYYRLLLPPDEYVVTAEADGYSPFSATVVVPEMAQTELDIALDPLPTTVSTPVFAPTPGTYATGQNVSITCATPDAVIRYTTDGSDPNGNSPVYSTPIPVDTTATIRARGFRQGWIDGNTATASYTITGAVAVPSLSPDPGVFEKSVRVTLSCATPGATIYYTTDDSAPTEETGTLYTSPFRLEESAIVRAMAIKSGWIASAAITGVYTVTGENVPRFSPAPGEYAQSLDVEISHPEDAVLRYTLDGGEPTVQADTYTGPIRIETTTTIRVGAFRDGQAVGGLASGLYVITGTLATPIFSPPPGVYTSPVDVQIMCSDETCSGASIRYTNDGNDPGEASPIYSSALRIDQTTTLRARAFRSGWAPGGIAEGTYSITGTVAAPVFSPTSDMFTEPMHVSIACDTSGADIYYTTDGGEPSEQSTVYVSPILVSNSATIRAKAVKKGWRDSETSTGVYTVYTVESPGSGGCFVQTVSPGTGSLIFPILLLILISYSAVRRGDQPQCHKVKPFAQKFRSARLHSMFALRVPTRLNFMTLRSTVKRIAIFIFFSFLFISFQAVEYAHSAIQRLEIPSSFNPVGSGARALGMGGAFIAVADDATAASWNPGGLIQLGRPEISIVGAFTYRGEDNEFGSHGESSGLQETNNANLNYFSVAYPFTLFRRNMIVALNRQHLFDFSREWEFPLIERGRDLSAVREFHFEQEGGLSAIGLAYGVQITPAVSLGVTLNAWQDWLGDNGWEQTRRDRWIGVDRDANQMFTYENYLWNRYSFSGYNANLGMLWNITGNITLGAVFKTPFTADLKHESLSSDSPTTLTGAPPPGEKSATGDEELDMPMSYGIGVACRLSDRFTVSADIYRTEWGDYILTDSEGNEYAPVSGRKANLSDIGPTHQARVGAEYLYYDPAKPKLVIPLRCGVFYDPAPAEGSPDDYFGFSLGSGIAIGQYAIDAAYQFRYGKNVGASLLESYDFSQTVYEHTIYTSVIFHF